MKRTIFIIVIIIAIIGIASVASRSFDLDIEIKPDDKADLIVVSSPLKDESISSPLSIAGRARGMWFFEGSFPVVLMDEYRNTIAEGHVTAQGEWMTEEFVPFLGVLQFNNYIKGQKGILVLKKDNPSGLPEHDDSIEVPILFK
jgi:hypothetical protein